MNANDVGPLRKVVEHAVPFRRNFRRNFGRADFRDELECGHFLPHSPMMRQYRRCALCAPPTLPLVEDPWSPPLPDNVIDLTARLANRR